MPILLQWLKLMGANFSGLPHNTSSVTLSTREAGQFLKRAQRLVDHVAVHLRVLAQLAIDAQLQTQVPEALELSCVE